MRRMLCKLAYRLGCRKLARLLSPSVTLYLDMAKAAQVIAAGLAEATASLSRMTEAMASLSTGKPAEQIDEEEDHHGQ